MCPRVGMTAVTIVEPLDVLEHLISGFTSCCLYPVAQCLRDQSQPLRNFRHQTPVVHHRYCLFLKLRPRGLLAVSLCSFFSVFSVLQGLVVGSLILRSVRDTTAYRRDSQSAIP